MEVSTTNNHPIHIPALLDTKANCFMDTDFAQIHLVFLRKLLCPVLVVDIYGRPIASKKIEQVSEPICVAIDNMACVIYFNIITKPKHPFLLGLPWFELHNPQNQLEENRNQVSPPL